MAAASVPAATPQPSALEVLTQSITKSVLENINTRMEANNEAVVDEVKGLLAESSSEIADRAAKRLKTDNPDITSPGNLDQYQHNAEVLRTIERAANSVLKGDAEGSIACLNEGKRLISQRQKLIRLADREEKGWKFVQEYVRDNLADDSDDEKQIKKTRRAAQEKFPPKRPFQRQPFRQQNRGGFRRNQPFRDNNQGRDQQPSGSSGPRGYSFNNNNSNQNRTDYRRDRFDRECHICRRRGHLSFDCPERGQRR